MFSNNSPSVLFKRMKKMEKAQHHRGPDDQTITLAGNSGFCHQRLSQLDFNGGKQPFYDNSKRYFILYNGEVYNYRAIRNELDGTYAFSSYSDTEVVLAAYIIWGKSCLEKLIGMFSFFIYDTITEEGFAARDPLGVKPFVYGIFNGEFIFASEIKAIIAALNHSLPLNEESLVEYVVAPMLSGVDKSILSGIHFLPPGSFLEISNQGLKPGLYANFKIVPESLSFEENVEALHSALLESVKLSVQADVPVASFLSGGLDSSILTTLSAKFQNKPFSAYTIQFQDHHLIDFNDKSIVNADDFPFAKKLAESLNLVFVPVQASIQSIIKSLDSIAAINDRIPAWEQEMTQHHLAGLASKDFKAVLVGDAADETHYGYFFLLNQEVNYSPQGLLQFFGGEKRSNLLSEKIRKKFNPLGFLSESYEKLAHENGFRFNSGPEENILAMSCLIYNRWLGRLLHNGDIHTMAFGLEARVPFANQIVLEVAGRIGAEQGFYKGTEKYVLKNAAKGIVPENIINRKKSALPRDPRMGLFYQEILKKLLIKELDFVKEYLNKKALLQLCSQSNIEENDRMMMFNIISLLYWKQKYAS